LLVGLGMAVRHSGQVPLVLPVRLYEQDGQSPGLLRSPTRQMLHIH
jgi:hypothetical protein